MSLAIAASSSAHARAPYAGVIETASASYSVEAGGAAPRHIEITAYRETPVAGEGSAVVSVSVTACEGNICRGTSWQKDIDPDDFTMDENGNWATLRTTFGGGTLEVEWRGCECFYGATYVGSSGISDHQGGDARARISLWGLTCRGPGRVDRETRVDTTATPGTPHGAREPRRPPEPFDTPGVDCSR